MTTLTNWQARFEQWLTINWQHNDKAHDIAHLKRVWATAQKILKEETTANELVVMTACYFHDIVNLPKNHPERHLASTYAAKQTLQILQADFADFPVLDYPAVAHAVRSHSFSAGIAAESLEAKIVQDADRLESLGAIGLARVFYTSGALERALFDPDDPFANHRQLDDRRWTLDHFQQKLLKLPATMHTPAGRRMAKYNMAFMIEYMAKLSSELQGELEQVDNAVYQHFMAKIE